RRRIAVKAVEAKNDQGENPGRLTQSGTFHPGPPCCSRAMDGKDEDRSVPARSCIQPESVARCRTSPASRRTGNPWPRAHRRKQQWALATPCGVAYPRLKGRPHPPSVDDRLLAAHTFFAKRTIATAACGRRDKLRRLAHVRLPKRSPCAHDLDSHSARS